jgi:hypothetical protein
MSQVSMKKRKGLRMFGDAGIEAVLKELQQLHDQKVLAPNSAHSLSANEKQAALQYLMFLKQKCNGTIKGCGCADGWKQWECITKEDSSSPTVAIECILISSVLDAMEGCDVATVDIPGAFMQADMDKVVHMKLEGKMADLLVSLDPSMYRPYVYDVRCKNVLYIELHKALYGTLRTVLHFWRCLMAELIGLGFVVNPYDWCVTNWVINGSQCTILWHVDDLKISHVDPNVVTKVVSQLKGTFGVEAPLTKNHVTANTHTSKYDIRCQHGSIRHFYADNNAVSSFYKWRTTIWVGRCPCIITILPGIRNA